MSTETVTESRRRELLAYAGVEPLDEKQKPALQLSAQNNVTEERRRELLKLAGIEVK